MKANTSTKSSKSSKRIWIPVLCIVIVAVIIVLLALVLGRRKPIPQNAYESALLGKWAYTHDMEKAAISFWEDGSAEFEGKKYQYTCDGERIHLIGKEQEKHLRYVQNEDRMYLYIQSAYTKQGDYAYQGTGTPSDIVGYWKCEDTNWTFEFTPNGTFMEDGALTGYYYTDEEAGTVKLVYGEALEDTVFYYRLTEEGLLIEYPWLTERMGSH
ncbi:MAG: hypothetical protein ACI4HQ_12505 [Acetatifactor sp.]